MSPTVICIVIAHCALTWAFLAWSARHCPETETEERLRQLPWLPRTLIHLAVYAVAPITVPLAAAFILASEVRRRWTLRWP